MQEDNIMQVEDPGAKKTAGQSHEAASEGLMAYGQESTRDWNAKMFSHRDSGLPFGAEDRRSWQEKEFMAGHKQAI